MLNFKRKLQAFYNKSFSEVSNQGGFFDIAHGEFLTVQRWQLQFYRTDGGERRTKKGLENIQQNEKLFYSNLERLGIIFIDNRADRETWRKIANHFNNSTAPHGMNKKFKRDEWAES